MLKGFQAALQAIYAVMQPNKVLKKKKRKICTGRRAPNILHQVKMLYLLRKIAPSSINSYWQVQTLTVNLAPGICDPFQDTASFKLSMDVFIALKKIKYGSQDLKIAIMLIVYIPLRRAWASVLLSSFLLGCKISTESKSCKAIFSKLKQSKLSSKRFS